MAYYNRKAGFIHLLQRAITGNYLCNRLFSALFAFILSFLLFLSIRKTKRGLTCSVEKLFKCKKACFPSRRFRPSETGEMYSRTSRIQPSCSATANRKATEQAPATAPRAKTPLVTAEARDAAKPAATRDKDLRAAWNHGDKIA